MANWSKDADACNATRRRRKRNGWVPMGAENWWRNNALALPGRDVPSLIFPRRRSELLPFDLGMGEQMGLLPACLAGWVREPRAHKVKGHLFCLRGVVLRSQRR